jgi:hypothetical protein
MRVALHLLATANRDGAVHLADQDAAEACDVRVKDYRQILRRLETAAMLRRQLQGPGRREVPEPRLIALDLGAVGWRGVWAWVDLVAAEQHVQLELGAAPGRGCGRACPPLA